MLKKLTMWKTKGMNQDLSVSAFNPEFAFENMNLRLAATGGNTTMSWVSEKGTKEARIKVIPKMNDTAATDSSAWITLDKWETEYPHPLNYSASPNESTYLVGTHIAGYVIGAIEYEGVVILFTTKNTEEAPVSYGAVDEKECVDFIYMLFPSKLSGIEYFTGYVIYMGNLNFSTKYPLEIHKAYEGETIRKLYWTDGRNQPRVINLGETSHFERWNSSDFNRKRDHIGSPNEGFSYMHPVDTWFDFVRELKLEEEVRVKKLFGGGLFPAGVIQYAFTYYDKYMLESNIFYTTPLIPIAYKDRGAKPDDKVPISFELTITGIDKNFDYIRVYSIVRTSLNMPAMCKRVLDIYILDKDIQDTTTFIDTGVLGDSIDLYELLYKQSNRAIVAGTFTLKDNTLFFGNIKEIDDSAEASLQALFDSWHITPSTEKREIKIFRSSNFPYTNYNQLYSYQTSTYNEVPCGYFKGGNYYRLGVQLQYKTGKWTKPIVIDKHFLVNRLYIEPNYYPQISDDGVTSAGTLKAPCILGRLEDWLAEALFDLGYRKIRPVVVFPSIWDRGVLCQGVLNPTVYTNKKRNTDLSLAALASWFFRAQELSTPSLYTTNYGPNTEYKNQFPYNIPTSTGGIPYAESGFRANSGSYNPVNIKKVEIQGDFDPDNRFWIDNTKFITLHTPEAEFSTEFQTFNYSDLWVKHVGNAIFEATLSDISILTESPTISDLGGGFVHETSSRSDGYGFIAGLFYEDFIVDEDGGKESDKSIYKNQLLKSPYKWMVYPWNKSGSLNNDINRPADKGVPSAILKKKILSNLRIAETNYVNTETGIDFKPSMQLFMHDEVSILKFPNGLYQGNVDTLLLPDHADGMYLAFADVEGLTLMNDIEDKAGYSTPFDTPVKYKTFSKKENDTDHSGIYMYNFNALNGAWNCIENLQGFGDYYLELVLKKEGVRMRYKSTPHIVIQKSGGITDVCSHPGGLHVVELTNKNLNTSTLFGGESSDALRENIWIPCGKATILNDDPFYWEYGDTYYLRWDCLKTYAFTPEDINLVVEIGSFMLETYVNIDGRYDKNRGQLSNIHMSPLNFNLINPIYTLQDNFFSYKIMDDSYYLNDSYPNLIAWSLTKESGADVDVWTKTVLANTLEMDGDKGKVTKLIRFNDLILAFQDRSISHILYNEKVLISPSDGVPIELANSGKVDGKRYLSDTVGCSNKWSVVSTPKGIYFVDSYEKSIYRYAGELQNLTSNFGFNNWSKENLADVNVTWDPREWRNLISYYNTTDQEVLFTLSSECLAYSEKTETFTSFYSYGSKQFLLYSHRGIWIDNPDRHNSTLSWHQEGNPCEFFGDLREYYTILIGNPEPLTDKVFTNLEFRASVEGEGSIDANNNYTPTLPFDGLEVWNEYLHGYTALKNSNGSNIGKHNQGLDSTLKRKFRIWRCDIPRNNALLDNSPGRDNIDVPYSYDSALGISRHIRKPMDRMRNPWLYIKLSKTPKYTLEYDSLVPIEPMPHIEMHDVVLTYYN